MKLEEFINQNLGEFEYEIPDGSWPIIQKKIPKKHSFKVYRKWMTAASVVLALGLSYYLGTKSAKDNFGTYASESYPNIESQFKQVNFQKEKLNDLLGQQPELKEIFINDLENLDEQYQTLKSEMSASPNPEVIISAMLDNLEAQSSLIKKQTQIIQNKERRDEII